MIEVSVELPHRKVEIVAQLTARLPDSLLSAFFLLPFSYEHTDITLKFLILWQCFDGVAALVKAGIAGVAIDDWIFIIAFSAETDLAVSLEQTFQFFETGVFGLELAQCTDLFYHRHLKSVQQHLLCLVRKTAFETDQNFSHPQLSSHCLDLCRIYASLRTLSLHSSQHFFPILEIVRVDAVKLCLPKICFLVQLFAVPCCNNIVEQHCFYALLVIFNVDDVQLEMLKIRRRALPLGVAKGGQVEASLNCLSCKLAGCLVFLESERDQLVFLHGVQLHLPSEKDP